MANNQEELKARKLPHSLDAEQAVLGCVMIDKDAPVSILNDLKEDDFYTTSHKNIFSCMKTLFSQGKNIDYISLQDELERVGLLESIGGIGYISSLTNIVPSAANFKDYMDIVKRNSILRKLILSSQKIIDRVYDNENAEDALAFAESAIYGVAENTNSGKLVHIKDSLNEVMDKFNKIVKDPDALQGIPTGFAGLDRILHGLQNSDLIILAARPGIGKTSLAMNIALHVVLKEHKSCAFFSLEMSAAQLMQRALCSAANVSMEKALRAQLDEKEWRKLFQTMNEMSESRFFVDDSSLNTPGTITNKCRRLQREKGLDFIVVDYLQLMSSGKRVESRQNEVSDISRQLKLLAKELNVPVLVLSQVNRSVENQSRKDKKLMLSDLRESGAIEQDADIVMFINRKNEEEDSNERDYVVDLSIAKHRNGKQGTIPLFWRGDNTTFHDLNKDSNLQSLEKSMPKETPDQSSLEKATSELAEEAYKNLAPPQEFDSAPFDEQEMPDIFDGDEI